MCVDVGSVNEEDNQRGIAHFVEHNAFDIPVSYSGRYALFEKVMMSGASFNAFTSFRTTCYQLWDFPASQGLGPALEIHKAQVDQQTFLQDDIDIEKGAVLGEARYRNSSDYIALTVMLLNHGGPAWRPAQRMPIGLPELLVNYTKQDLQDFYDKWYRMDSCRLLVVGDVSLAQAEEAIKATLASIPSPSTPKPSSPALGTINPAKRVLIQEVPGTNGVSFNLMMTRPYIPRPTDMNFYRTSILNTVASIFFDLQVGVRLEGMYPGMSDSGRSAGLSIEDDYSLGVELHMLSVESPGNARTGTWRADVAMGVTELRRLALHGPSSDLVSGLLYLVSSALSQATMYSGYDDSLDLIDAILGGMDPDAPYLDPFQKTAYNTPFLESGLLPSAVAHIQAEAQYMYRALIEAITDQPYTEAPFDRFESPAATLNIFTGVSPFSLAGVPVIDAVEVTDVIMQVHQSATPDGLDVLFQGSGSFSALEGLPLSGSLVDVDLLASGTLPAPGKDQDYRGVQRYMLQNRVPVNVKASGTGDGGLPAGPPGEAYIEIVALGGKATLTPALVGACEFVNHNLFGGMSVYYPDGSHHDYTHDLVSRYLKGVGASARLSCQGEHMVISATLSPACPNYPEPTCTRTQPRDYNPVMEALRLYMNPMMDDNTKRQIEDIYEMTNDWASAVEDPATLLLSQVDALLLQKAYQGDPRMQPVTLSALMALNPVLVQDWVREHFRAGRFEINVAGDFDVNTLLKALQLTFGTLAGPQTATSPTVGLDPYSLGDAFMFNRTFPASDVSVNCTVPSSSPERAFVLSYGPSHSFLELQRDTARAAVMDALVTHWAFLQLRGAKGYGYFVQVASLHSVLFPAMGYYRMYWAPGGYPSPTLDALNIQASLDFVKAMYKGNITEIAFKAAMGELAEQTEARLQNAQAWLGVLRGVSLAPPAVWDNAPPYIKDIEQTDIVNNIRGVQYGDVQNVLSKGVSHMAFMSASLATIPMTNATIFKMQC
eukprot:TRINITY_DN5931_c0_g1_i1.p1 TRINITY_DN5931_c0_g1~~TRINITY_DN5931_c0_g1_i1.p1  ORF type:complete len:1088 (-),score=306.61 TRINITY_DN5931_c0_g1_i1:1109-4102(-)